MWGGGLSCCWPRQLIQGKSLLMLRLLPPAAPHLLPPCTQDVGVRGQAVAAGRRREVGPQSGACREAFLPILQPPLTHLPHYPTLFFPQHRPLHATAVPHPGGTRSAWRTRSYFRCRAFPSLHTFLTTVPHHSPTPLQDKIRLENRELLRRASAVYGPAKVVLYIKVWGMRGGRGRRYRRVGGEDRSRPSSSGWEWSEEQMRP